MKSGFRVVIASAKVVFFVLLIASFLPVLFGQSWEPSTESTPLAGSSFQRLRLADFDGDGRADAAVVIDGNVSILRGDGKGGFPTTMATLPAKGVADIAVGDYDGTGTMDILVLGRDTATSPYSLEIYSGDGKGGFAEGVAVEATDIPSLDSTCRISAGIIQKHSPVMADFALACDTAPGVLFGAVNDGSDSFSGAQIDSVGSNRVIQSFSLGDINGDGLSDIALTSAPAIPGATSRTDVLLNANGKFQPVSMTPSSPIMRLADYDGDALADLFSAENGEVEAERGDGSSFAAAIPVAQDKNCLVLDVAAGSLVGKSDARGLDVATVQMCKSSVIWPDGLSLASFLNNAQTQTAIETTQGASGSVSYTVPVTSLSNSGVPTGTVGISINDGPPVALPLQNGVASGTAILQSSSNSLSAVYSGSPRFSASSAAIVVSGGESKMAASSLRGTRTLIVNSPKSDAVSFSPLATITVGASPKGVAIDESLNRIYVANYTGNSVTVIDGNTDSVITTISDIDSPQQLAVNSNTHMVYVTANGGCYVIDGTSDTIVGSLAHPEYIYEYDSIAVDPVHNQIDVSGLGSTDGGYEYPSIFTFDGSNNSFVSDVEISNFGLAFDQNTGTILNVNTCDGTGYPSSLAYDPTTNMAFGSYCPGAVSTSIVQFDPSSGLETNVINSSGTMVAVNPAKGLLYSPVSTTSVAVMDETGHLLTTVSTGASPYWVAVNSITGKAYVTNYAGNSVSVIGGQILTPTITVSCSPNPITYMSATTCTAHTSGGTGTISLSINGSSWFTSNVDANGNVQESGFNYGSWTPGSYTITATYSGDANYNGSSASTVLNIQKATPSITASASASTVNYGQMPNISVHVDCNSACGQVQFTVDGGGWGTNTLDANGNTVAGGNPFPVGDDTIGVTYLGNSNYGAVSTTVPIHVNPATTSTTILSSENPSLRGDSVTYTCNVLASYAGPPTGTIDFDVDGNLVSAPAASNGSATYVTSSLAIGSHTVTCYYPNQGLWSGSTSFVTQAVSPAASVTELASSVDPTTYGASTTFTALLDTGGQVPTGTVAIMSNGTSIGEGTISQVTATNLLPYSQDFGNPPWGGFCGPTNYTPDTPDVVAPDGTQSATKFVLPNVSTFVCGNTGGVGWGAVGAIVGGLVAGQTYTASIWLRGAVGGEIVYFGLDDGYLTAATLTTAWQRYTYTSPSYSADGEAYRGLEFYGKTGGETYYVWGAQVEAAAAVGPYIKTGASSASGSGGIASFSTSSLPVGNDVIVGNYSGDANVNASDSLPLTQVVNAAPVTISVASSSNPSVFDSAVTFSFTVEGTLASPTGSLTISDGSNSLATVPLTASATPVATAQFTTSALQSGSHNLTITYSGDSNYH